ncbi:hypothetical protein BO70DRAFT_430592 [Aspergillus heteromorphus CBS 117.55]|uniref:Uncharacterized protein n=1 Tax=Aspergillus heteromorphus CBS 117.55 TaxID=1448321 RepID=A0A317VRX2_9EURO|nr:uncharacterized protein BO70DRAFT_430592 [Aspergillus heteromorphus CBS 117.55]PWY77076.1 hypothetical protein BO70DRAFT_430592 [Aspergillus heteromorphus CBS 117.55]
MKSILSLAATTLFFAASVLAHGGGISKVTIFTDQGANTKTSVLGECVKAATPDIPVLIIDVQSEGKCTFSREDLCIGDEITMGEGSRTFTKEYKVGSYKCDL